MPRAFCFSAVKIAHSVRLLTTNRDKAKAIIVID